MAKPKPPRQQPDFLLSIDPAEAAGWALFENGKLVKYGAARGAHFHTFLEDIMKHISPSTNFAAGTVLIEQGWLNRSKGAITLSQRRGIAQSIGEFLGFRDVKYVGPSTWQNALGWRKGQDTKEWSLERAAMVYALKDITNDVADAVNLGSYYLGTFKNG